MKHRQTSQRQGEPRLLAEAPVLPRLTDPAKIKLRVEQAYHSVGILLDEEEESVLLADALCFDNPIVGVSKGFVKLTEFTRDQVLGRNCRVMLGGVPEVSISKSVRKNLRDFMRMCRLRDLIDISEVTSLQPNTRASGTQFMNFFLIGRITVRKHPFLLGVQTSIGEGLFVKLSGADIAQVAEDCRAVFKRVVRKLIAREEALREDRQTVKVPIAEGLDPPASHLNVPGFLWFHERLQDHCLLLNDRRTAMRREPQELSTNCLVFGDRPVRRTSDGLYFAIAVDDAVATFEGLPVLGFTKRKPSDSADLYPTVSRCLGASVLIGACGEAFARDQWTHFKIGFKQPPREEVESWCVDPSVPPHKRRPPVAVQPGDILGCLYTHSGHAQFWCNGVLALDFDVGRPLEEDVDYYAVADVCLSAYSITLLPFTSPKEQLQQPQEVPADVACSSAAEGSGGTAEENNDGAEATKGRPARDIDAMVNHVVNNAFVEKAIRTAVASCQFCVSIADPRGDDIPLIAVSEAFESMTGYARSEILGVSCRFLNQGCPVCPTDKMGLRIASQRGSTFTALLPNKKKSGEMFINLLDLRGLTIARNIETGEDLWYLIGIQADVTGLADCHIPEDHLSELQEVAWTIRALLKKELSLYAAECFDRQLTPSSCSSQGKVTMAAASGKGSGGYGAVRDRPCTWQLLEEPIWREYVAGREASSSSSRSGGTATQRPEVSLAHLNDLRRIVLEGGGDDKPVPKDPPLRGWFTPSLVLVSVGAFSIGLALGRLRRKSS